jgi:hypothetical protein
LVFSSYLIDIAPILPNKGSAHKTGDGSDYLATFLLARDRLAAIDDWEAEKVAGIAAAAARRRDEHRVLGAGAVCRIRERGVTVADIAKLASIPASEVRAYLKAGNARRSAEARPRRR